jgi:hypothetical protein
MFFSVFVPLSQVDLLSIIIVHIISYVISYIISLHILFIAIYIIFYIYQITVTFAIDANGIMNVSGKDTKSGRGGAIEIKNDKGRLTRAQIEHMIKTAEEFAEVSSLYVNDVYNVDDVDDFCEVYVVYDQSPDEIC